MDYATLIAELQQPQYADMTDAEAAEALNAPSQPTRREVPARELIATAVLNGAYAAIDAGAESDNPQVRGLCRSVLVLLALPDQDVDLDDPRVIQMFGALQQAGIITPEQAAAIDALATTPGRSRAQEIGVGVVTEADVVAARAWWAEQQAEQERWQAYALLRERLNTGYGAALARLMQMEAEQSAPPTADEVRTWLM